MTSDGPMHIYLDTNAFRYFGIAFQNATLAEDLRDKMLISPLSAFEVFGQLADLREGEAVLNQVHAIRNWTNPQRSGLLPWPDEMLYQIWHRTPVQDTEFVRQMTASFNACLTAESVDVLREEAVQHKQVMDRFKLETAQNFKNMIDAARAEKAKTIDIADAWIRGIANRVHAEPDSRSTAEIISSLSAYYEYDQSKLKTALDIPLYNPVSRKNQNDIIDSEQLVYLADKSLFLVTSDGGFKRKVIESEQNTRIITAPPEDLMDARKAESVIRRLMEQSVSERET